MSRGDFWVARSQTSWIIQSFQTKAANTAIKAGEPVIQGTGGDVEYVIVPGANVTTADTFVGFAASDDTVTSSADGKVDVIIPAANTVFRGLAHTPGNLATTVINTKVVINHTAGVYKIDEDLTTNGLCLIVDYTTAGEVDFLVDMSEFINA